jgi:hypothetical protein
MSLPPTHVAERNLAMSLEKQDFGMNTALLLFMAVGFSLTGLWMGEGVFFVMAASALFIGASELLEVSRPFSARAMKWIGRSGMVGSILFLVFILAFGG